MRILPPMAVSLAPPAAEPADARQGLPAGKELSELGPQESRLACLRLHISGLSLRQIAAKLGISKSSVHRYLAAGTAAIDVSALAAERRRRLLAGSGLTPAEELDAIQRWIGGRRRHRPSAAEFDTVRLTRERANAENRERLVSVADRDRCFAFLRQRGQRRLALEVRARRGK
jgi:AcrR family transcriptional regulator